MKYESVLAPFATGSRAKPRPTKSSVIVPVTRTGSSTRRAAALAARRCRTRITTVAIMIAKPVRSNTTVSAFATRSEGQTTMVSRGQSLQIGFWLTRRRIVRAESAVT